MTRVLVTGGTGYLGAELLRQAAARGHELSATSFTQPPPDGDGVSWLRLDIRDREAVFAALAAAAPEVVIHTAFRQNAPALWATTAVGAGHVATAAAAMGARLIHLSSDVIFDGEGDGAYTEADEPSPISPYGAAKAAAEALVAAVHPDAAIVRTSLIYGFAPLDRQTRFALEVARGERAERLFVDEFRCPVYVVDLAAALLELAALPHAGVLHLAGAEVISRFELGRLMALACGEDPAAIVGARSAESPVRRPRNCVLDCALARSLLAAPPRGLRAVLTDLGRLPPQPGSAQQND